MRPATAEEREGILDRLSHRGSRWATLVACGLTSFVDRQRGIFIGSPPAPAAVRGAASPVVQRATNSVPSQTPRQSDARDVEEDAEKALASELGVGSVAGGYLAKLMEEGAQPGGQPDLHDDRHDSGASLAQLMLEGD